MTLALRLQHRLAHDLPVTITLHMHQTPGSWHSDMTLLLPSTHGLAGLYSQDASIISRIVVAYRAFQPVFHGYGIWSQSISISHLVAKKALKPVLGG